MIVENPQNGMKFCEIDAYSLPSITHTNLLQFVVILGAVTPKNSSCGYLLIINLSTAVGFLLLRNCFVQNAAKCCEFL